MSSSISTTTQNPPKISTSSLAQEAIKTRARFTDYLPPETWPLCRESMKDTLIGDSNKAKEELIQSIEERRVADCRVLEITPKTYDSSKNNVILYFHGGCLTLGAPDFQMQIPAPVAHRTGWKIIAVDYPLAPYVSLEDPHPAHTAAFNVYKSLLEQYESSEIAILGDSAGGNIAFGMALMARDNKLELPGAIVAYEPWVDLDQSGEAYHDKQFINQTVVLTPECMASARDAAFGKKDNYSAYVSPSKGDYKGFESVAIAIYTASRDLLRKEGEELADKLRPTAKCVEYFCKEGMWHGFQEHYGLPEAEESAEKAAVHMLQNLP